MAANHTLVALTNHFTVVAQDAGGAPASGTVSIYAPSTVTLAFDANGNLTNDGRRTFQYDAENQLTNVFIPGAWRSEFQYDGLFRRRVRKEYTWTGSAWSLTNETRYIYDGMAVLQERDGNNIPVITYTRGLDLSGSLQGAGGIGGLLAMSDQRGSANSPTNYFYHADGSGNVTALMDRQGQVVARYLYDPFGNLLAKSGSMADFNRQRFSSKEAHLNSGLVYFGYRYYEPDTQRWLNQDPIGERGGFNLYQFVLNDPVNWFDPYGEDAITIGPVTIPIPFTTSFYEEEAQSAHERQHRKDWLKDMPGWKKEQRGFAAEIPEWHKAIKDLEHRVNFLERNRCNIRNTDRSKKAFEKYLNDAKDSLAIAESIANDDDSAMDYWNAAARRWYQQPVAPRPPFLRDFNPGPPNLRRNEPPPIVIK